MLYFKIKILPYVALAIFLLLIFSCTNEPKTPSPFSHIKDEQVKDVLQKAIARSGGWKNYKNIDSIFYKKRTVLFDSLKNVERDVTQFHKYQLKPELSMSIKWEKGGEQHEIVFKNNKAGKFIDNKKVAADAAALHRTCMAANYVLFMPFKLLDPGVELKYKGTVKLPNGKEVHAIAANYNPDENINHSTNDNWEYYFDKNNYDFVANMVDHGDYFALIYNDEYVETGGLRFNSFRPSFRVNENREHLWQRGEFYYSGFILK